MKFLKKLKLPLIAAACAIGMSAGTASAEGVLEEIQKRGTLKVGMSTFVPWAMRDKEGNLMGFEIDVATKVAEDLEVEVEFVPTAWSGIIPALLAKKFDLIIGGMSITPARNLTVNFAAGKLFPKATVRRFDDDAQAFQEVVNGNAHATISSAPKPRFWSEAHPNKMFLPFGGENLTKGDEAFALRKGDADALNYFSNWILVHTSNGWLKETHDKWFQDQSAWKDLVAQ